MNINITNNTTNNKFIYELYDKINDYDFRVISMPNLRSNVPINASYSVIYSQILRYFNATNDILKFYDSLKLLKVKMIKQNFSHKGILKQIKKFFDNYSYEIVSKFSKFPTLKYLI